MNELIYAIVSSFKTIIQWKISKLALISGVSLMIVWIIIGLILWHPLTSFTASLLNFVPFALIKSNGAFMLSSLLFVQAILVSLAFIIIILSTVIVKDAKEKRFPLFIISIALVVIAFWVVIWFFNHAVIYTYLEKVLTWLPFATIEKAMSYIFALYILYSFYVVSLLLFVSTFSREILKMGSDDEIEKRSNKRIFIFTARDSLIFLIVSIIAFPLFFVPIVNFFVQILVWVWLIKDTFSYDIGDIFYNEDDIKKMKKEHKIALWSISFMSAMFNFIPILNIYSPYFGEFALYHYFDEYENKLRL